MQENEACVFPGYGVCRNPHRKAVQRGLDYNKSEARRWKVSVEAIQARSVADCSIERLQ
jgi:hypothetical protein